MKSFSQKMDHTLPPSLLHRLLPRSPSDQVPIIGEAKWRRGQEGFEMPVRSHSSVSSLHGSRKPHSLAAGRDADTQFMYAQSNAHDTCTHAYSHVMYTNTHWYTCTSVCPLSQCGHASHRLIPSFFHFPL